MKNKKLVEFLLQFIKNETSELYNINEYNLNIVQLENGDYGILVSSNIKHNIANFIHLIHNLLKKNFPEINLKGLLKNKKQYIKCEKCQQYISKNSKLIYMDDKPYCEKCIDDSLENIKNKFEKIIEDSKANLIWSDKGKDGNIITKWYLDNDGNIIRKDFPGQL
jgi:Zn finger protein HypA/HybF involved in hydrogenase expression